jgi:hypothetical protein
MRHVNTTTSTTGLDLKVERVKLQLPARAVADAMGISQSRLSRIEKPEPVTDRMLARYRLALETCRTSGTAAA